MRINQANLYALLRRINATTGNQEEPWTQQEDGTFKANPGTYVLDWAYGGVQLAQLVNESGGERNITGRGTKRETYHRMLAFLTGLETPNPQPPTE
jgi:hypothetical protein